MKVYIASGLENWKRARVINEQLRAAGIEITYDWTQWGEAIYGNDGKADQTAIRPINELRGTAINEINGVTSANLVLALMPGGRGTHFELGAAYALGIPAAIVIGTDTAKIPTSFHYLLNFNRFEDDQTAVEWIIQKANSSNQPCKCKCGCSSRLPGKNAT